MKSKLPCFIFRIPSLTVGQFHIHVTQSTQSHSIPLSISYMHTPYICPLHYSMYACDHRIKAIEMFVSMHACLISMHQQCHTRNRECFQKYLCYYLGLLKKFIALPSVNKQT